VPDAGVGLFGPSAHWHCRRLDYEDGFETVARGGRPLTTDIAQTNERIRAQSAFVHAVKAEVAKVIVGQDALVERLLIGMLCRGHILVEGVPGLAKTLTVSTLARAIDASFVRIQFTPDLLPADVTGTTIYSPQDGQFHVRKGPIFSNIVLADEINRAPAKVQSALLEAMQERQVSIGGSTFPLDDPFMVLATQNPIEHEGTYALPEAQLDRFMLKVHVTYPSREEEKQILDRYVVPGVEPEIARVATPEAVTAASGALAAVHMDQRLRDYIVHLVYATREPEAYRLKELRPLIEYGASPRASIFLAQAARAYAFVNGRAYVEPDDVKEVALEVLRHRVIITYEAEAENLSSDDIVRRVLAGIEVP
jgi:MoxR-like ATPase